MTKVLILYVEAGHGHRKVAEAVERELRARNRPDFHIEISDALEKTSRFFRCSYPKIYFYLVLWVPWLWGLLYYLLNFPAIYFLIAPVRSLWNWFQSGKLRQYLESEKFDLILFTHFFPAEVCATAKKRGKLNAQLITIVTDVIPHTVWQNPGTDLYWVMAEESVEALLRRGVAHEQICPKGIPVSSEFLETNNSIVLKNRFGLKPNRLTILFTSGSFGIGPVEAVLNSFQEFGDQIQVLVICGKNRTLFGSLNQKRPSFPLTLFGFVNNMHEMMSVSDLLIAKPGGATMCESLVKKIPMIIMSPIPGQESYNAKWLLSHQAAFQIAHSAEVKDIVSRILNQPSLLVSMRQAIERIAKPRATSDIADFILERSKNTA